MISTATGSQLWMTRSELTVLVSRVTSMGLEILAGRMVAPESGSSIYTQGGTVGAFPAALSLGYHRGGQQAEQASNGALARVFIGTAAYIAGVILLGDLFIQLTAGLPVPSRPASLLVIMFLFGSPTYFLDFISPYAAELSGRTDVGSTSGHVYAVGTVGSIIGAFATTHALIPSPSVTNIGLAFGLVSVMTALTLVRPEISREGVTWSVGITAVLVFASATGGAGLDSRGSTTYHIRTTCQELRVAGVGGMRTFYPDSQPHSVMDLDDPTRYAFDYTSYFHVPFLLSDDTDHVLFVSGGEFAGPRMFLEKYPNVIVDVVELDPEVADIAEECFRIEEPLRLNVHTMDGRQYLREANRMYDLIVPDAYQKDKVSFQLTTQEFMQPTSDRLDDGGALFANVISAPNGLALRFYHTGYRTIRSVYPQVYSFPAAGRVVVQNIEVVVTKDETLVAAKEPQRRNRNRNIGINLTTEFISYWNDEPTDDMPLLTDDRASVNNLLDPMVGQRYIVQRINETEQRAVNRNAIPRSAAAGTAARAAQAMVHDRIHTREPTHDYDRQTEGVIGSAIEHDGHWVARTHPAGSNRPTDETAERAGGGSVELVVTFAVRGLFFRRLDVGAGESPIGCRLWYRKRRR